MMMMGLLVGLAAMIFWTPYCMCKGIWILTYDTIETSEKIKCMIPVYNMFTAERTYTGGIPTVFITTVASMVLFVIRLLEVPLGINGTIAWVTIILLILFLLASYVCNAILVFRVLRDADVTGLGVIIVFTILFPIGQYYIGNILPRVLRNALKEESTFL